MDPAEADAHKARGTHPARTSAFWKHTRKAQTLSFQSQLFCSLNPNSDTLRNISEVVCAKVEQHDVLAAPSAVPKGRREDALSPTAAPINDQSLLTRTRLHSHEKLPERGENRGQGTRQHPWGEARKEQDSRSQGTTLHGTAPHRPVPGQTRAALHTGCTSTRLPRPRSLPRPRVQPQHEHNRC